MTQKNFVKIESTDDAMRKRIQKTEKNYRAKQNYRRKRKRKKESVTYMMANKSRLSSFYFICSIYNYGFLISLITLFTTFTYSIYSINEDPINEVAFFSPCVSACVYLCYTKL